MDIKLERDDLIQDKLFIGGQWLASAEGKTFSVLNPANGRTIIAIPDGCAADAAAAADAAQQAFAVWRTETTKE
uniref:aldehyde dehydrogenase family protein n=1 Tax=Alcaligenes xylosoxydans xylosoxydans TaxID=85698 RepID=UPI001F14840E